MMTEMMTIEKKTNKKKFQIYFPPTLEQKRHHNLFRMRPGSKAALLAPW